MNILLPAFYVASVILAMAVALYVSFLVYLGARITYGLYMAWEKGLPQERKHRVQLRLKMPRRKVKAA